jgi:K+-transporting ATPase ATPase C chain
MQTDIFKQLKPALLMLIIMTVLTGTVYPLVVTGIAGVLFPEKAEGSMIERNGNVAGSKLIGQPFEHPGYFWARPSATSPYPYNAGASSGSNYGPASQALLDRVQARVDALQAADPGNNQLVPVDLVTASASGLDPHISVAAAEYQVARVARARGLDGETVHTLVEKYTEDRQFGILGERRVNVLLLNLALDEIAPLSEAK